MQYIANSAYLHHVPHTISICACQRVPKSLGEPAASKWLAMKSAQYRLISVWAAVATILPPPPLQWGSSHSSIQTSAECLSCDRIACVTGAISVAKYPLLHRPPRGATAPFGRPSGGGGGGNQSSGPCTGVLHSFIAQAAADAGPMLAAYARWNCWSAVSCRHQPGDPTCLHSLQTSV